MSGTIKGAGSVLTNAVDEEIGFFESHPKAIAIGAAVAGAILTFLVMHFL